MSIFHFFATHNFHILFYESSKIFFKKKYQFAFLTDQMIVTEFRLFNLKNYELKEMGRGGSK